MSCCTPICRKWTVFGFATFFIIAGTMMVVGWHNVVEYIKNTQLNLANDNTKEYKLWKETPIPMYMEVYLFNWSNWEEVVQSNWKKNPEFHQMGPYTYSEKHIRKNVIFNDNRTVTYKTQRIWHYVPEKSSGSLDDKITNLNPILVTIGNAVKDKHVIVKIGVDFFIKEKRVNLTVTQTVRELIFDGYDDPLVDLLKKLHLKNIDVPFDNFAWFAARNGSIDYDGVYNMFDGTDDIRKLGRITTWNYQNQTKYYSGYCGRVNGTSGELWYPVQDDDYIDIFVSDMCSTLTLKRNGTDEKYGIGGHKYVGTAKLFDNGSVYPEMACFSPGQAVPSGVRNISECKSGAPFFISYPHFYLADSYYLESINGMQPNQSEHEFILSIEPETGLPLDVRAAVQLNLHLQKIDRITLLDNVKEHFLPAIWFKQYAILSQELAGQAKLILILPAVGEYTGYFLLGFGCLLCVIFAYITFKDCWKDREEERLLNQQTF